jgi:hypothetical protein
MNFFAVWFVIMGFHLELYEPYEEPEAHFIIARLCRDWHAELYESAARQLDLTRIQARRTVIPVYENCRMEHRWRCLSTQLDLRQLESLATIQGHEVSETAPTPMLIMDERAGSTSYATYKTLFFAHKP